VLDRPTIGTGVALAALREGMPYDTFPVAIKPRPGSRFGRGLRPNLRILRAMAMAVWRDAEAWLRVTLARRIRSTSS
ncbi:MAG: hypothetical protein M3394_01950, partial [Actinomycetota bacterium]|nr:hypothetical protein [Actinomycetota bacterium]